MTSFDENTVRRGQPKNRAQFAKKNYSDPEPLSKLPAPPTVDVREGSTITTGSLYDDQQSAADAEQVAADTVDDIVHLVAVGELFNEFDYAVEHDQSGGMQTVTVKVSAPADEQELLLNPTTGGEAEWTPLAKQTRKTINQVLASRNRVREYDHSDTEQDFTPVVVFVTGPPRH